MQVDWALVAAVALAAPTVAALVALHPEVGNLVALPLAAVSLSRTTAVVNPSDWIG